MSLIIFQAHPFTLILISSFIAVVGIISRIALPHLLTSLKPVWFFFTLLFLLYLFFTKGTPVPPFPLGPIGITYEGFYQGTLLVGKFMLLVLCSSLLTMVTSPAELTTGMERLLRPFKFPGISSHDLAVMLSIALSCLPTLLKEINKIREAQLARGANFKTRNLIKKAKAVTSLVIPLTINIFRRADELATAMEARGYQPGPRTYLKELAMTPLDYLIIIAVVAATLIIYCL
ncbi:MAG: energy-coupling factor transporter transmembrane component T [Syntrophomonadaceae bacterium]|nr:energy-coupling factor transporter transmembrane component T [Syntrophomonadaceae bacterium]